MKTKKIISIICLGSMALNVGAISTSNTSITHANTVLLQKHITKKKSSTEQNEDENEVINNDNVPIKTSKSDVIVKNITSQKNAQILDKQENLSSTNTNLDKSSFWIYGDDGVIAERISFNSENMTISKSAPWGNQFSVQLMSGQDGSSLKTSGMGNDNLNGSTFKYGDVISLVEGHQLYMSFGKIYFTQPSGTTRLSSYGIYDNYVITKDGIQAVQNKNLTVNWPSYQGSSTMNISGKTLPNTKVYIYCSGGVKTIMSNSNGAYSLSLPYADAPINSEIRVFVNSNNNATSTVGYDTSKINVDKYELQVANNTNVPVFNIGFNPVTHQITSYYYPKVKNYTGIFNGNNFDFKLIDENNGNIIKDIKGNRQADGQEISTAINNTPYKDGNIIEVQANPKSVLINAIDGKNTLNSNIKNEYYQITPEGLINVTNKFVNYSGLDILGTDNTNNFTLNGKIKPNTNINVNVDNKNFSATSNSDGEYSVNIKGLSNITSQTKFTISSDGYINTQIYPTINNKIDIQNSFINFYNSQGYIGGIALSIGFNPETMEFNSYNYGGLSQKNIEISLLNSSGENLYNNNFEGSSLDSIAGTMNTKQFTYGDIIGISYNKGYSIPTILSNNNVMGNIDGSMEYFEITQNGLVPVKVGKFAKTNSLSVNNGVLKTNISLVHGQSQQVINGKKELVLLNSSGNVIAKAPIATIGASNLSAEISLGALAQGQTYELGVEINDEIYKVLNNSNIYGNSNYSIQSNEDNVVTINKAITPAVNITSADKIASYMNELNSEINSEVGNSKELNINSTLKNKIIANEFMKDAGSQNLSSIYGLGQGPEFINWLLNNYQAMKYMIEGGEPGNINLNQLTDLYNIYNTYTNSRWGFNLKLAVAISLAETQYLTNPVAPAWGTDGGSPVERYKLFEGLNAQGGMMPIFNTENIKNLMTAVKSDIPNSQILLTRDVMLENHNSFVNENSLLNGAYTIDYNMANPYTGVSVFNGDFYGSNPSILTVWRVGGVCGAISKLGTATSNVFGVSATPVGQPGHCAFIYDDQGNWEIGNNIFGWQQSYGGDVSNWSSGLATNDTIANYSILYNAAVNRGQLDESNTYIWLANSLTGSNEKINAINKAISINGINLEAFVAKINAYKNDPDITGQQYIDLANTIMNNFKAYPMPMFDLLLQIKQELIQLTSTSDYNEFVSNLETTLTESKNYGQPNIAQDMINRMKSVGFTPNPVKSQGQIYLNDWGTSNVVNVSFVNGKINVTGQGKWIGTNNSDYLEINLYNSKGQLIKGAISTGESVGSDFGSSLNNLEYAPGEYITVSYLTGAANNSSLGFLSSQMQNTNIKGSMILKVENSGITPIKGNKITIDGNEYGIMAGQLMNLNSSVLTVNSWPNNHITGTTMNLIFNDNKMTAQATWKWLGADANKNLNIALYTSTGSLIKNYSFAGNEYAYSAGQAINGQTYSNKDILVIDNSLEPDGVADNSVSVDVAGTGQTPLVGKIAYTIDNNKLVPINGEATINGVKSNFVDGKVVQESSNIKDIYFDGHNLVLNGAIDGIGSISKNDAKQLIIVGPKGSTEKINTAAVNWYSGNSENYSGYQAILTSNEINELVSKTNYKLYIEVKGEQIPINIKTNFEKDGIAISNIDNIANLNINNGKSIIENTYYDGTNLVLNGQVLGNGILSKTTIKNLILVNNEGEQKIIKTVPVNWYSENAKNYSGYQAIISLNELNKLTVGENYKAYIKVDNNLVPISINKDFKDNGISISNIDNIAQISVSSKKEEGFVEDIYSDNNNIVINGVVNGLGVLNQNISKNLEIVDGKNVIKIIKTVPVNWYSGSATNYAGYQVIINKGDLQQLMKEKSYELYINVEGNKIPLKIGKSFDSQGVKISENNNIGNIILN